MLFWASSLALCSLVVPSVGFCTGSFPFLWSGCPRSAVLKNWRLRLSMRTWRTVLLLLLVRRLLLLQLLVWELLLLLLLGRALLLLRHFCTPWLLSHRRACRRWGHGMHPWHLHWIVHRHSLHRKTWCWHLLRVHVLVHILVHARKNLLLTELYSLNLLRQAFDDAHYFFHPC